LLREKPEDGRAHPPVHGSACRHGDGQAAGAVPGGLHAGAATRDRAPARRGRAARRLGDRRARARDRHRPARLCDLGRLSGHGRGGPVYLHRGGRCVVRERDLQARTALVTPYGGDYYTQAKKDTNTAIDETLRLERRCGLDLAFGRISVTERVVAYQKKSIRDQATLETVDLDLPETSFETEAIWYLPEPEQLDGLEQMPTLLGTLHAAEHSMIALLPLWAMCDRWDIGGLSTNIHFQTGRPTVFIYDGHSGGVGITERG